MEFLFSNVQHFSYAVVQHPLYSAIFGVALLLGLLNFYCKLTLGVYDDGQDMTGKTVLITGASDGIGRATAQDLARRNARVLLACRNLEKAGKVAQEITSSTGNPNVIVKCLDLASFDSVRKCAKDILKNEEKLHVLINNAGMVGHGSRQLTEDGCEIVMQTNHLGHFLLTLLLLDLLKKSSPCRIINVSSMVYQFAKLDLDDLSNKRGASQMEVYGQTKLANILFTRELAARLDKTGVTVNALHPGCVKTHLTSNIKNLMTLLFNVLLLVCGKTSEEGAQTTIRLAVDPSLVKTTGKYFSDCKQTEISKEAMDNTSARRLFVLSEQIVGATFE